MIKTYSPQDIDTLCKSIKNYDQPAITQFSPHMKLESILREEGYEGCLSHPFRIRRSQERFEYLFQRGLCPKINSGTFYFALPPNEHKTFFDTLGKASLRYDSETIAHQIMLAIIGEFSFPLVTAAFLYNKYHSVDRTLFGNEIGIAMGVGLALGAAYHPLQHLILTKKALKKIRREYLPNAVFTTESLDPEVIKIALEGKIRK